MFLAHARWLRSLYVSAAKWLSMRSRRSLLGRPLRPLTAQVCRFWPALTTVCLRVGWAVLITDRSGRLSLAALSKYLVVDVSEMQALIHFVC